MVLPAIFVAIAVGRDGENPAWRREKENTVEKTYFLKAKLNFMY